MPVAAPVPTPPASSGPVAPSDAETLELLHPRARRPALRLGLGAAVVLVVVAVGVAAWWSAAASGGGDQGVVLVGGPASVPPGASGDGAADGVRLPADPPLLVHVLGAVADPGLVELAPGARVVDAVAAAGGFTGDADPAGVNLARPLADGEQLRVPRVGESPPAGPSAAGGAGGVAGDGLVHVNTATVAELDTLPRIGPALAERIVEYREANGPFRSIDELGEVAGIGDAVLAGLDGHVAL